MSQGDHRCGHVGWSPDFRAPAHHARLDAARSLLPDDAVTEIRAALGPDGLAALAKAFPTPEEKAATSRVCELDEDGEALQALSALGLVVRYDAERNPPQWVVALQGVCSHSAATPELAGEGLNQFLAKAVDAYLATPRTAGPLFRDEAASLLRSPVDGAAGE